MARPPYSPEQRNRIVTCFINAASAIMEEEGAQALTLRRVAQKAGFNSATLYNYFKDLDHLSMYASMKYLQEYSRNLATYTRNMEDEYLKFISIWEFFCDSAFRHPQAFFRLFYGKYSGELEEIIRDYYAAFPEELGDLDEETLTMMRTGPLMDRNLGILLPLAPLGYLTEEEAPILNEVMMCCFKELLYRKCQMGDELDNHTLVDKQISYIKAILRKRS